MARYHGKSGQVYVSTTGTGTCIPVVALSSWSISLAKDRVDVTAFGDSNKQKVQGLAEVSGSISGWFDDTEATLFTAADSADGTKLYLYPDAANAPTKYWYGAAFLDISEVGTQVDGAVSVSASFDANGTWARK
jgi:hypothetical protein